MALTLVEAAKLSQNPLAAGVLTAIATSDELTAILPMVPKRGESFLYDREKALPSANFIAPGGTVAESSATFDQVTVPLRLIVDDVDVDLFFSSQMSELNAQMAIQIEKKLKALGRTIGEKSITGNYKTGITISTAIAGVTLSDVGPNQDSDRHGPASILFDQSAASLAYRGPGDTAYGTPVVFTGNATVILGSSNPSKTLTVAVVFASFPGADAEEVIRITSSTNEWDGLQRLCPVAQTVASSGTNGDALSFEVMDELIDEKVKVRENCHFVCNGAVKRQYLALLRATGGATPADMVLEGINRPVPTYRGIPIIQSDWIPSTEAKGSASTLSSMYLVSVSADEGFYMGVKQNSQTFVADLDPRDATIMGVNVREIGELETKEAIRTRISFYGATALGSELAIARASEITTL